MLLMSIEQMSDLIIVVIAISIVFYEFCWELYVW